MISIIADWVFHNPDDREIWHSNVLWMGHLTDGAVAVRLVRFPNCQLASLASGFEFCDLFKLAGKQI